MHYELLPLIFLADLVAGAFLFLIVVLSTDMSIWGYVWIAALILSTALRSTLSNYHKKHLNKPEDFDARRRHLVVGAFCSGVIWGLDWIILPANPSTIQIFMTGLWLAGMLAGAATTIAIIKEVYIAFMLPVATLYITFLLVKVDENRFVFIAAYLMYLAFITPIALRISRDMNSTIKLKLDNFDLNEKLKLEAIRLQENKEELETQRRRGATLQSQKQSADEKYREVAEERLLLLDAIEEGIFGIDNIGEFTFINTSALNTLELEESEIIGRHATRLLNKNIGASDKDASSNETINSCITRNRSYQGIDSIFSGAGTLTLPVRFSCKPVKKNDLVIGAVVSFADISNQKEMEAMLLQSKKMEAIGRLTGGVAHDFNNLLTVIMGNLQFAMNQLSSDESISSLLSKIMAAAKSGAELNNRLLSFSREQSLKLAYVDANEMLLNMREFLARLLGEDIQLIMNLCEEKCGISTDLTQLENAILNLCVNARDAMPKGGILTIGTQLSSLPGNQSPSEVKLQDESFVEISITDDGDGIPAEIQKQIFEPFFTTKDKGKGTGLGLSTTYGFIRQCGGNITLNSRFGEWTTFRLFLPLSTDTAAVEQPVATSNQAAATKPTTFTGNLLVVEDDDGVREVAINMFEEAGFSVISANDGISGLAQFQKAANIDLVFSDVVMPGGMTGIDMAEEILKLSPNTPILLVTGYTDKALKDSISYSKRIVCISKPYDTETMPGIVFNMMNKIM